MWTENNIHEFLA